MISSLHCDSKAFKNNETNPGRIDSPVSITPEIKSQEKIKLDLPLQFLKNGLIKISEIGEGYEVHGVIGVISGDDPRVFLTNKEKLPIFKVSSL